MLSVKKPVLIKMILTEKVRSELNQKYDREIQRYELEIEQLQFQSKKLLHDAQKKGAEALRLVQGRIQREERVRKEKVQQYQELLNQLQHLPEGSEIEHSKMETDVIVKVGDRWDKLIGKTEIVVKDGIIIEIRSGGEENHE